MLCGIASNELEEQTSATNAVTGEARVPAMARVVTEFVRRQKTMHEHMGTMNQQMIMHMVDGRGMMDK